MKLTSRNLPVLLAASSLFLALSGEARPLSATEENELGLSFADFPEVRSFLASTPALAPLAGLAIAQSGNSYTLALPSSGSTLYIAKSGGGDWFAVLPVASDGLGALFAESVVGGSLTNGVLVFGSGGSADASQFSTTSVPYKLLKAHSFSSTIAGLEFHALLEVGEQGALGTLRNARWFPGGALKLSGSFGLGVAGKLLGTSGGNDLSVNLALEVPKFTPAPFSSTSTPRITFGETTYVFQGARDSLLISGTQKSTLVALPGKTAVFDSTVTFTKNGSSYRITVSGKSTLSTPLENFLQIPHLDVKTIGVEGEIHAASEQAGFGGNVRITGLYGDSAFDAEMGAQVENGMLVDVGFQLNQSLTIPLSSDRLVLETPRLGLSPATAQGYFTASKATLYAKRFGFPSEHPFVLSTPALAVGPTGFVAFGRTPNLDLNQILKKPAGTFPKFGKTTVVVSSAGMMLPSRLATLAESSNIELPSGSGLRVQTDFDLSAFETTKQLLKPSPGTVLALSGELSTAKIALAAALPGGDMVVPGTNDALKLLKPQMEVSYDGNVRVGVAGQMNIQIRPTEVAKLEGSLSINSAGVVSVTGSMLNGWTNPAGLLDTELAPGATVTLSADPSGVNVGFQAGGRIKTTTYKDIGLCVGLGPTGLKGIGLSFKATEVSAATAMQPFAVVLDSMAASPTLSEVIPGAKDDLLAISKSESYATDYLKSKPQPVVKDAVFYILTPGASCPDLPVFSGAASAAMRTDLGGRLYLNMPTTSGVQEIPLASMNSTLGLQTTRLKGKSLSPLNLAGVLELKQFELDTEIQSPANPAYNPLNPGHFFLATEASLLGASHALEVELSNTRASFAFEGAILGVGGLGVSATTVGTSLATANDIRLGMELGSQARTQDAITNRLSKSFVSAADSLYAIEKDVESSQEKLENSIDSLQSDLNGLKNDLASALAKLSGWGESACRAARSKNDPVGKEICKAVYPILDDLDSTASKLSKAKLDLSALKTSADYVYAANRTINQKARGYLATAAEIGKVDSSVFLVKNVTLDASLKSGTGKFTVDVLVSGTPVSRSVAIDLDHPEVGASAFFLQLAIDVTKAFELQARKSGSSANVAVNSANPANFNRIGAALKWDGGRAYLFDGSRYERYSTNSGWSMDSGYPKTVSVWKACNTCYGMDAALKFGGYAYFFRGDQVIRWNDATDVGTPPVAIATYFPMLPASFLQGVDAAEYFGPDRAYFFKGNQVVLVDTKLGTMLPGYPKLISQEFALDPAFQGGIDSAMWGEDGKAYFFKGDQYLRLNATTRKMDTGYPKSIVGAW